MAIRMDQLLRGFFPAFDPLKTKAHLAQFNKFERPLDVFIEGTFPDWQSYQTKKNFPRDYVLSLIETESPDIWLFAGLWQRHGEPRLQADGWAEARGHKRPDLWFYDLTPVPALETFTGRLHVRYHKTKRQGYRNFETIADEIEVSSLIDQPRGLPRFAGYRNVHLEMPMLRQLIDQAPEDWRTALSSVAGIYLITDPAGRLYVGSAQGVAGFWGRWADYARTGHGENVGLRESLGEDPFTASAGYRLSILETADTRSTRDELLARESHWKRILGSRAVGLGLNRNG